jgi:hypothetical protein
MYVGKQIHLDEQLVAYIRVSCDLFPMGSARAPPRASRYAYASAW